MNRPGTLELLQQYESRNIIFIDPDGSWPIVWERAKGVHVWDEKGRRYVDLTAAFGVAAAGHSNARVVAAAREQLGRLVHAMGDVHPHRLKAELAQKLSQLTFERWSGAGPGKRFAAARGKTIFCNSGFEAVEVALKTARLATGKTRVIVFENAYHGLGYGALNATHRAHFRAPFRDQLRQFGRFVPFPMAAQPTELAIKNSPRPISLEQVESKLRRQLRNRLIGAILVEPIQVRGGVNVPPVGFLPLLRKLCDEYEVILILDEIFTGFGRTGKWFACEHTAVVPDVICLGKALTGGFPLSACVGRAELMDTAWPPSRGEAIHTSTFLGHPVGCAMALANITEIEQKGLVERSAETGTFLLRALLELVRSAREGKSVQVQARGQGLLAGLELLLPNGSPATTQALDCIKALLQRGFVLLPEGEHGNVISFTPPLTITKPQLQTAVEALGVVLDFSRK